MITLVPSRAARSIRARIPTATAAVCSRNPTMTGSTGRGSRSAVSASNDDVYRVGISSPENMARMTSRTASVGITRTIPSRAAICVAMVDFPTPVAPR